MPESNKASSAFDVIRRSADYHPSIWGDYFLNYSAPHLVKIDCGMMEQHKQLREEVRQTLMAIVKELTQKLNFIDVVQRLGVAYHFESEIEATLQQIYQTFSHDNGEVVYSNDLHTIALLFRLLRQQGYPISCNVFNRFQDKDGKFKESLIADVRGMLSLYQASYLRVQGEDILDEALCFTTTHLQYLALSTNPLSAEVTHALNQPIRMGLTRLEARQFMSFYEACESYHKLLLHFAILDFNFLQKLHQSELSDITRWWKDLDVAKKLPFARDRIVECYFWILGVYFEPKYFLARRILTRVIALTSIIDDIYDVYGTFEELVLFTDAIQRWDNKAKDQLPMWMRVCYQALLDLYNMIDEEMAKEGKSYRVDHAKAAMKDLAKAYFIEAKWYNEGYVPNMEEYMGIALVTCAYKMLATTSLVGMADLVTEDSFDWVSSNPLIVQASSVISRLMDDMVSHEFEQKRGHVVSAVECYMKEHGTSEEELRAEFNKQVTNAWKTINAEMLQPTAVPMPLLERVLNLARVIQTLYKDGDGYTNSRGKTKGYVTSQLVDPVPMHPPYSVDLPP